MILGRATHPEGRSAAVLAATCYWTWFVYNEDTKQKKPRSKQSGAQKEDIFQQKRQFLTGSGFVENQCILNNTVKSRS
jgi:hypothetical protein